MLKLSFPFLSLIDGEILFMTITVFLLYKKAGIYSFPL